MSCLAAAGLGARNLIVAKLDEKRASGLIIDSIKGIGEKLKLG